VNFNSRSVNLWKHKALPEVGCDGVHCIGDMDDESVVKDALNAYAFNLVHLGRTDQKMNHLLDSDPSEWRTIFRNLDTSSLKTTLRAQFRDTVKILIESSEAMKRKLLPHMKTIENVAQEKIVVDGGTVEENNVMRRIHIMLMAVLGSTIVAATIAFISVWYLFNE
jgi:hypothetical protein